MPQSLQTIAEISIAFAGFSGLVVALRKNSGPLTNVQKYRLRVLLTLAFGALFLSLLPELLEYLGTGSAVLWLVASLAAAVFSLVFLSWWLAASRRMMKRVPEIFNGYALARMAVGHAIIIALLLAVAVSLLDAAGPGIYLAALVWYLLHAAQQFSRMLFIQPARDNAESD